MPKQNISVLINLVSFAFGIQGVQDRQNYLKALHGELAAAADYADDYEVESLTITGSNPLQYPADALTDIIKMLRNNLGFKQNAEITINALPGSVTYTDLRELRNHGVNRVSFGMSSFVQSELDTLGRTYSPKAMEVFMRMVQLKMVFFNYDVTLYYGLPDQTLQSFGFSIEQAIKYMSTHITLLPYEGANSTDLSSFYREAVHMLGLTDFQQYTPRHFSRPDYTSQWNKLTYSNQPRLSFGVGTVSKIDAMLSQNTGDVDVYIAAEGSPSGTITSVEAITQDNIESNILQDELYNLRACDFTPFGSEIQARVHSLCERGLLEVKENDAILTAAGKADWRAVSNALTL